MQTQQGNMLQALRNVEVFLDQNADRLAEVVQSDVRQRLTSAITGLQSYVSAQSDGTLGSQGATQKHRTLQRALVRDHMLPIARIAAADLPDTPEIQPLRMPPHGTPVQRLAAMAYGMADTATKHSAVFTRATLPPDFAAQLTAATDAMIASIGERTKHQLVRRGATQGLKSVLGAGRKVVGIIDALVKSRLQDEPTLLAAWKSAKRVHQLRGGRSAGTSAPAAPTEVTPAEAPSTVVATQ